MAGKNYRDLIAWQKAMDFVEAVYRVTKKFPKEETYGLTSQLRRCSVSVPSKYIEQRELDPLLEGAAEVGRLITGLRNSLGPSK